jgi:hypothetical protein
MKQIKPSIAIYPSVSKELDTKTNESTHLSSGMRIQTSKALGSFVGNGLFNFFLSTTLLVQRPIGNYFLSALVCLRCRHSAKLSYTQARCRFAARSGRREVGEGSNGHAIINSAIAPRGTGKGRWMYI